MPRDGLPVPLIDSEPAWDAITQFGAACPLALAAHVGVTLDVSAVTDWANQGTAGALLDFTMPTAALQPVYNASDANWNGRPSITWANDRMDAAVTTTLDIGDADDFELVIVFRPTTTNNDTLFGTSGSGDGRMLFQERAGTRGTWVIDAAAPGVQESILGGDAPTQNAINVLRFKKTGAASPGNDEFTIYVNGAATGAPHLSGDRLAIAPGANGKTWRIGDGFDGDLVEMYGHLSAFSAEDLASFTSYLNSRYGTSFSAV